MKIFVLANDIGERLWPMTSAALPKALLPLYSKNSMLVETLRRTLPLCKNKGKDVYIITTSEAQKKVKQQKIHKLFKIPAKNVLAVDGPDTVYQIIQMFPDLPNGETVLFIPSDQFFWPDEGFLFHMSNAIKGIDVWPEYIFALGIEPTLAAGNMNYVRISKDESKNIGAIYPPDGEGKPDTLVTSMVSATDYLSTPDLEKAEEMITQGWVWDLQTLIAHMGSLREHVKSTDNVVASLIKSKLIKVILASKVMWSIVENWAALKYLTYNAGIFAPQDDKSVHSIDAMSNLVQKDKEGKEVILVGVDNLIVIDTEEKLLIASMEGARENL